MEKSTFFLGVVVSQTDTEGPTVLGGLSTDDMSEGGPIGSSLEG